MTEEIEVDCPFCGEPFTIVVDTSGGDQAYIEDCAICCRPIRFTVRSEDGELRSVDVDRSAAGD